MLTKVPYSGAIIKKVQIYTNAFLMVLTKWNTRPPRNKPAICMLTAFSAVLTRFGLLWEQRLSRMR
jgi:hypothetical protein